MTRWDNFFDLVWLAVIGCAPLALVVMGQPATHLKALYVGFFATAAVAAVVLRLQLWTWYFSPGCSRTSNTVR